VKLVDPRYFLKERQTDDSVARNYYEYEIREVSSNEVVKTLYIPEDTVEKGWVLGQWYEDKDSKELKTEIKSEDGLFIATYITSHYDSSGGELF